MTREAKLQQISNHDQYEIKGFCGDYGFLSNMYPCNIIWMNLKFDSVEAAYQASKFNSLKIAKEFSELPGYESKKLSNKYKDKTRLDWDSVKYNIMCQLVFQKFLVNDDLKSQLINTLDRYIEETNYWNDTYWGVCKDVGENKLGEIIMKTRSYFAESISENEESEKCPECRSRLISKSSGGVSCSVCDYWECF